MKRSKQDLLSHHSVRAHCRQMGGLARLVSPEHLTVHSKTNVFNQHVKAQKNCLSGSHLVIKMDFLGEISRFVLIA